MQIFYKVFQTQVQLFLKFIFVSKICNITFLSNHSAFKCEMTWISRRENYILAFGSMSSSKHKKMEIAS